MDTPPKIKPRKVNNRDVGLSHTLREGIDRIDGGSVEMSTRVDNVPLPPSQAPQTARELQRSDKNRLPGRPFEPGHPGMGGRPKGLATLIREMTRNGQDLVEGMISIWNGEPLKDRTGRKRGRTPRVSDRIEAGKWLADRGFGRVPLADGEDGYRPEVIIVTLKPGQDY